VPIYEFICESCGNEFEQIQSFSDSSVPVCTKCESIQVVRRMGRPAIHFKGSGWYINDSKKSSESKSGNNKNSSENGKSENSTESATESANESATESKVESKSENNSESKSENKSDGGSKSESTTTPKKNTPAPVASD
jgi:putative FmdB family regulatory protein